MKNELIEQFKFALKAENMKFTPQRLSVLAEMVNNKEHRECEEIYLSLRTAGNDVSRATVYRTMDILVKYKFARKIEIGDGRARYERKYGEMHHDHIICMGCDRIIEFIDEGLENKQVEISKKHGFKLVHHIHQLYGYCEECRTK